MAPTTTSSLPSSVHVSSHPCIGVKLSQLRSHTIKGRETKNLVHEIALLLGCEALRENLTVVEAGRDTTPLGYEYTVQTISPARISLIPILRSGLGMVEALQTILPDSVPVHHLGLFRDPISLQPVEYYNNLPNHHHHHHHQQQQSNPPTSITPVTATAAATADEQEKEDHLAILIDPIIATGGTCAAAIQTLREWGVTRILVIAILGSVSGLCRAADEWPQEDHHPSPPNTTTTTTTINDPPPQPPSKSSRRAGKGKGSGVEIWVAGVDDHFDDKGMIIPGLGDVGDRLFMTVGK